MNSRKLQKNQYIDIDCKETEDNYAKKYEICIQNGDTLENKHFNFVKSAFSSIAIGASFGLLLVVVSMTIGNVTTAPEPIMLKYPLITVLTTSVIYGIFGTTMKLRQHKNSHVRLDIYDLHYKNDDGKTKQQMISASKNHPLINTLVYPDYGTDLPISETVQHDKIIDNAVQALEAMDHTSASCH
ncbi:MAG: hypothetical protein R3D71_01635 [Rickettsiales bacterium]